MLNTLPEVTEFPDMPEVNPPKRESNWITDEEILGAVARGWCHPDNSGKTMDEALAVAIAHEIRSLYDEVMNTVSSPNLGCATTKELLEEVTARIELDGKLEYKTVGEDNA